VSEGITCYTKNEEGSLGEKVAGLVQQALHEGVVQEQGRDKVRNGFAPPAQDVFVLLRCGEQAAREKSPEIRKGTQKRGKKKKSSDKERCLRGVIHQLRVCFGADFA